MLLDAIEQARIQGVFMGVLLCFSLSESIGMNRGTLLPLASVTRILSSKFWMMECDVWADLLIICRWANPTTIYCTKCRKENKTITTSCKHVMCLLCAAEELNSSGHNSCPQCGQKVTAIHFDNIDESGKRELLDLLLQYGVIANLLLCIYAGSCSIKDEGVPCSKRTCSEDISGNFGMEILV